MALPSEDSLLPLNCKQWLCYASTQKMVPNPSEPYTPESHNFYPIQSLYENPNGTLDQGDEKVWYGLKHQLDSYVSTVSPYKLFYQKECSLWSNITAWMYQLSNKDT
jgi:hypothetical protein